MAFIPVNFESGRLIKMPASADGSTETFAKGDALVDDGSGFLKNAASGTAVDIKYIAWEGRTVSTNGTELLCYKVDESVRILADVDAAAAQTDMHTYCDLATLSTLNPDASVNDLFYLEKIATEYGAVGTSTKVYGYFTNGTPNS
jgi:hypothetical protein